MLTHSYILLKLVLHKSKNITHKIVYFEYIFKECKILIQEFKME